MIGLTNFRGVPLWKTRVNLGHFHVIFAVFCPKTVPISVSVLSRVPLSQKNKRGGTGGNATVKERALTRRIHSVSETDNVGARSLTALVSARNIPAVPTAQRYLTLRPLRSSLRSLRLRDFFTAKYAKVNTQRSRRVSFQRSGVALYSGNERKAPVRTVEGLRLELTGELAQANRPQNGRAYNSVICCIDGQDFY